MVHFGVFLFTDGHEVSCSSTSPGYPADGNGVIDSDSTGCHTDALGYTNGYIQATDLKTGKQTNRLPVMVYER